MWDVTQFKMAGSILLSQNISYIQPDNCRIKDILGINHIKMLQTTYLGYKYPRRAYPTHFVSNWSR